MYNEAIINYGSISNNTFRRGIVQGSPSSLKAGRKRQVRNHFLPTRLPEVLNFMGCFILEVVAPDFLFFGLMP
jgi:hypothetical protein